jgi:hypothetical protein
MNFEFAAEIDATIAFASKCQVQFLEDPLASIAYFKYVYERNKLDPKYANPPLTYDQEMRVTH